MAGKIELQLAPQTLDALGFQNHDFIQLGHKIFKILRRKQGTNTAFALAGALPDLLFFSPSSGRKVSEPRPLFRQENM